MKLESSPLAQLGAVVFIALAVMGLAAWQGIRAAREQEMADVAPPATHGFMGIRHAEMSDDFAQRLGLDSAEGVVIVDVIEGSPAQTAGLLPDDVIRRMDDSEISVLEDLRAKMRASQPGEHMTIHITRARQPMQIDLTLTTRPPATAPATPEKPF